MEKEFLSYADVIWLLNKVKEEITESDKRKAIAIAIEAVNAVQIALKRNEHEDRQNEDRVFLS